MKRFYTENLPEVEASFEYDPKLNTYKILKAGTYSVTIRGVTEIIIVKEEDLE